MTSQSFQLVMQKGPNPGKIYELVQDELTIGRDITNRVVINDPEVSRRHSKLTLGVGGYTIEDLGSTNGTSVDGQRLMGPHLLRPGQIVMLGEKITLAYETMGFDPNATLVGAGPETRPAGPETFRTPEPAQNYAYNAPQAPVEPPSYPPPPPAYQPPAFQQPAYQQPAYQQPPPPPAYQQPAYSGQVPAGPGDAYDSAADIYDEPIAEAPRRSNRTLLFAGCGLLLMMLCCMVVVLLGFDALDLYCQPPFDNMSGVLWSCSP